MAILTDNADAVIGVDTRADTRAGCLLDHMGRQVAEITAALSRSMLRGGARRPCASAAAGAAASSPVSAVTAWPPYAA